MADEPTPSMLRALNIALDEDEARAWLDQWRASSRQERLNLETGLTLDALARNHAEPAKREERQAFERLMRTIDPDAKDIDPGEA